MISSLKLVLMAFFLRMLNVYNVTLPDTLILLSLMIIFVTLFSRNLNLFPAAELLIIILLLVLLIVFLSLFMMHLLISLMKQLHTVWHLLAPLNFTVTPLFKIALASTMEIAPFVFVAFKNIFLLLCALANFLFGLNKCRKCHLFDHEAKDCPNIVCFNCDETGHTCKDCPAPEMCLICRSCDHHAYHCPFSCRRRLPPDPEDNDDADDAFPPPSPPVDLPLFLNHPPLYLMALLHPPHRLRLNNLCSLILLNRCLKF